MKKVIWSFFFLGLTFLCLPQETYAQSIKDYFFKEKRIYKLLNNKGEVETFQLQRFGKKDIQLVRNLYVNNQLTLMETRNLVYYNDKISSEFVTSMGIWGESNWKGKTILLQLPTKEPKKSWTNIIGDIRTEFRCERVILVINDKHTYETLKIDQRSFNNKTNQIIETSEITSFYAKDLGLILQTDKAGIIKYSSILEYEPLSFTLK